MFPLFPMFPSWRGGRGDGGRRERARLASSSVVVVDVTQPAAGREGRTWAGPAVVPGGAAKVEAPPHSVRFVPFEGPGPAPLGEVAAAAEQFRLGALAAG